MHDQHFALALPMHLIQALRLAHALMESEAKVHVSRRQAAKFDHLRKFFDLDFEIGGPGLPVLAGASISHEEPLTRLGSIERPLIFPHGIVERCRAKWCDSRPVRFSFCGLVNEQRRHALDSWTAAQGGASVEIFASELGRQFPEKAWDESYYDRLARSEFVLCPRGDCVWSYRFFEAVLCGAIPIAEQACAAFDGFEYELMSGDARGFAWSADIAERNFAHAIRRLTVPLNGLNAELKSGEIFDGRRNEYHQRREAIRQALATLPRSQRFIVIDQNEWCVDEMELAGEALTFLDQGAPADDAEAIAELEKFRAQGAAAALLASPCFWWLDYYRGFAEHLRTTSRRVLENESLIVFELK